VAALARAVLAALLVLGASPTRGLDTDGLMLSKRIAAPWTGDLDGMVKREVIRALVVENRTFYFLDGATQRGLSFDALQTFEQELNRELGRKEADQVEVVYIPVDRGQLIAALLDGRGDLAVANLTVTPERLEQVDFSEPLLRDVKELVVTGPTSPALGTLEDLSGQVVFVRPSSSYFASLTRLNGELAAKGRPPVRIEAAPEQLEDEDLLEMLNAGLIPLTVMDDHIVRFWAQIFDGISAREDLAVRDGGEIAWAFRKGSPALKRAVDGFARRHRAGTTLGNTKLRQYLKSTRYVANADAAADRQRYLQVVGYFQRYGGEYGLDWLLLTAQGYRESRLDQRMKSPAGAVGIMQLMPVTGREMGVGDIRQREPNIHAGVKYLRSMMDRYFADAPMDDENKALFAFACYNAGPARVAKLRAEAAADGLDPNRWFGQVERVAARRIGQETVRYVRDIYKYYVAYKLGERSRAQRERIKREVGGPAASR
jgi:membrane-bound lytic murein transglycosylase MltF